MIYGDRIKQVREILGLTQEQFANNIGIKRSAIAQVETGRIAPNEEVLQRIFFQTGFPISFFKQPSFDFPLGSLLFRARASTKVQERRKAHQYARTIFEIAEKMGRNFSKISLRLPRFDDEPIGAAVKTRSSLGLSPDLPISNLINTIEKNGVMVLALPLELRQEDAFSAWVGIETLRPLIVISNINAPGDRLRFSVAHELGHLVIHQAIVGDIIKIEREANLFASEFLMPKEAMLKEILSPVTLTSLIHLKGRWKVSIQALIRRAFELRIITQRQYKYLMQQINIRGLRFDEPVNIPKEKPRMLAQMTEMLYGNPIDYKKLSSYMNLPRRFVKETLEAHAIKIVDTGVPPNNSIGKILKFTRSQS